VSDLRVETLASTTDTLLGWSGLTPDDIPLVVHNRGTTDIYWLKLAYR
jgi:hypothetical protein